MVWDVICPSCRIPSIGRRVAREDRGARALQDLQHRVRRRLQPRDRARVPRRARDPRGRDPHVLHRRARRTSRTSRRRSGSPRASGSRCRSALAPGYYLLRSPQLPRSHELRVTAQGGVRRLDLTLGERERGRHADRGRSAAHADQPGRRARCVIRVERAGDRALRADRGAGDGVRGVPRAVPGSGARARPADGGDPGDAGGRAGRRRAGAVPRARRQQGVPGRGAVLRAGRPGSRASTAAR